MVLMGILLVFGLLVLFGIIVLVVIAIVVSRRDDFVNPFSSRTQAPPTVRQASADVPETARPNIHFRPVEDQETALVDWLLAQASAQTGVKLSGDQMVHDRIVNAARNAMKELEFQDSTKISLPFLAADASGPKHFEMTLTRQMFNQLR